MLTGHFVLRSEAVFSIAQVAKAYLNLKDTVCAKLDVVPMLQHSWLACVSTMVVSSDQLGVTRYVNACSAYHEVARGYH